ncbi:hypothetical protein ONE63_009551 [Megalurothrips usitatus]|uniref:Uncharacterized protein n=1 Tax=Megalurothrips usitatus TaxID=439358 RepID=A0AAV7XPR1_9NEOP|nr:hypothetical protein ONE63_009551 [Megalurothrips usitatus]
MVSEHHETTSEDMALQNVNTSSQSIPCTDSTIAVDAGESVESGRKESDPSGNHVALCDKESDLHLTQPSNDMTFTTLPGTSLHEQLDADREVFGIICLG